MTDFATWRRELEELLCRILGEPVEGLPEEPLRSLYAQGYSIKLAVTSVLDLPRVHHIGGVKVWGRKMTRPPG
jgi:hypothetical protein